MGASATPLVIGRYAIYDKIASGGMASVHFGRLLGSAGFSRTVAVKKLHAHLAEDPEFLATMIDEARLAARIHHPNVVPTLDVLSASGELLVIMEYVSGESLSRVLKAERDRSRLVPLPTVSAIAIGALHGLHAAHEAKNDRGAALGIVHRDVSPQNILLGVDGMARVIDFGVAKAAGRLQTTREGVVKGKISYMAPEQLEGEEVTRQADVYAMAVVLWEMLAGRRLFLGDSDGAIYGKVMAGAKEPPSRYAPNLPAELDALVMTALARDPAARFATARDMADKLKIVVPPAFATDVGAWVEDVASEALVLRSALLAEIESTSHMTQVAHTSADSHPGADPTEIRDTQGPDGFESGRRKGAEPSASSEEATTLASQTSSLSVETPKPSGGSGTPSWRSGARVALVLASTAFGAGVATLAWRGAATSPPPMSASAVATASATNPPVAASSGSSSEVPSSAPVPPPSGSASQEPSPVPSAVPGSTSAAAVPAVPPGAVPEARPAAKPAGRPRPAARPTAPFRYPQPD